MIIWLWLARILTNVMIRLILPTSKWWEKMASSPWKEVHHPWAFYLHPTLLLQAFAQWNNIDVQSRVISREIKRYYVYNLSALMILWIIQLKIEESLSCFILTMRDLCSLYDYGPLSTWCTKVGNLTVIEHYEIPFIRFYKEIFVDHLLVIEQCEIRIRLYSEIFYYNLALCEFF